MLLLRTSRGVDPGIPFLRSLGTSAHVWLPGANGVSVASLPSNNYLLSDGSTGYSTVDGVDGLTLDGMGVQSTLVALIDTFTFNPAGTTPPTTNAADTFLGVPCVSVTMPINAGGYGVCRGDSSAGGAARHTITAGRFYQHTYSVALSRALTGAESVKIYTTGAAGSSELFLTSANAANAWIDGASSRVFVIAGIDYPVVCANTAIAAPVTVYLRQYSVKEYTGTHLTQATTANKPLVRRGAYNLLPYSEQFNLGWTTSNMTVAASDSLIPTAANAAHAVVATSIAKTAVALKYVVSGRCKANGYNFLLLRIDAGSGDGVYVGFNVSTGAISTAAATSGAGWVAGTAVIATPSSDGYCNFSIPFTTGTEAIIRVIPYVSNATGAAFSPASFAGDTTSGVNLKIQLEQGVVTAGDYTPTTTTAASNPSAGKYWWSFDGSNDSLLSGNLGITNACTIVIAGRVNSLATVQTLFAEDANGVQIYIDTSGIVTLVKFGVSLIVNTAAATIVAGVPFVVTVRLSGGTAVIRKNGVQVATAATALAFSATTGARIGTNFDGTTQPAGGALGWVVPLPVALSDADCLTVERLVAAQFPGLTTPDGDALALLLEDGSGFLTMETGDLLLLE